jgi:hypothetical protein
MEDLRLLFELSGGTLVWGSAIKIQWNFLPQVKAYIAIVFFLNQY